MRHGATHLTHPVHSTAEAAKLDADAGLASLKEKIGSVIDRLIELQWLLGSRQQHRLHHANSMEEGMITGTVAFIVIVAYIWRLGGVVLDW